MPQWNMTLHPGTQALLAVEAAARQLSLPQLIQRLLPAHDEPDSGHPVPRMLAFADEYHLTLGEDLRLRDLL